MAFRDGCKEAGIDSKRFVKSLVPVSPCLALAHGKEARSYGDYQLNGLWDNCSLGFLS